MDAFPLVTRIAQLPQRHGIEAVLIGNAAGALQGAPVTTIEGDFSLPADSRQFKEIEGFCR